MKVSTTRKCRYRGHQTGGEWCTNDALPGHSMCARHRSAGRQLIRTKHVCKDYTTRRPDSPPRCVYCGEEMEL